MLSAYVTTPRLGSFTPVLENDSIKIGVINDTVPLGKPVPSSSRVSDAPGAGIVIVLELLDTIVLSSGTVELDATDLYNPPALVSNHICANASKVGAVSWKYTVLFVSMASSTLLVTNAVVASCVVFVPKAAVGAVGVPVSAGLAIGAASVIPYPERVVGIPDRELNAPSNASVMPYPDKVFGVPVKELNAPSNASVIP